MIRYDKNDVEGYDDHGCDADHHKDDVGDVDNSNNNNRIRIN